MTGKSIRLARLLIVVCILMAFSCTREGQSLRMATTTSTDNTGLLEYLKPIIARETGIDLTWVAVGSGNALALGKNCDADILLVHDPKAEDDFVRQGHGIERRPIMYNDFVLIGPADDPAGIRGMPIRCALARIAGRKALFASRGDNSGTHVTELELWKSSKTPVPEKEPWYLQTGQGMINTIIVAEERRAYTLTDRGTFLTYEAGKKGRPALKILVEGDSDLRNQYSLIAVNPRRCPSVKFDLANKLIHWMSSGSAKGHIENFRVTGKRLFVFNAAP